MDFKSMLTQLSQLSEATKETPTGRIHKADPGGYGRKFDTDEEGDEKKDDKKEPAAKRGRGRPKKGADSETGEVAKYDNAKALQSFMVGNIPKKLPGKASVKHSLKEYFEELEQEILAEDQPIPVVAKQGDTQSTGAGFLNITDNSPAGQAMKNALGQLAQQKKAQIVVPTQQQTTAKPATTQGGTTPAPAGATGQAPAGQAQVKEKWDTETKVSPEEKGKYAGKTKSELLKAYNALKDKGPHKKGTPEYGRMRELAFAIRAKSGWGKVDEADIPSDQVDMGAGLGAGRSAKVLEKKMKVSESKHRHSAARLLGKAHALAKEGYNCKYDSMDEAKMYHEGYKEGLDECYGQGVYESMPSSTMGMAGQAERDMDEGVLGATGGAVAGALTGGPVGAALGAGIGQELTKGGSAVFDEETLFDDEDVEEGNAFTAALAKTPKGGKFTVGGKTFTDRTNYDSKTFESLEKQLNSLLESAQVDEGMTVSISKGQQGMPNSVSVTAQDGEADKLLSFIKQAGLGLFGDEKTDGYGVPDQGDMAHAHGDISVVDDHDGMMAIMKKLSGGSDNSDHGDYEDEESHDHEEDCGVCGESACKCDETTEMVDEVESYDQEEEQVAEDNPPDSDAAETTADENAEAAEDEALAQADQTNEEEEPVNEWANDAGQSAKDFDDETFETDMKFMTKVISGGLNKQKSTGQTTVPVIAGQNERMMAHESVSEWQKLAGIK